MHGKSLVFLVGFMGSGKSTAGKKLAASLGWSFIDLDRKIEEKAGKTIPEIFSSEGEAAFRKLETEILRTFKSCTRTIISTGGGTPCHGDNMDFMLETGVTVYLRLSPDQLVERLMGSTEERPLLKNIPDSGLRGFIETRLADRESYYNRANVIVDGINLDIGNLQYVLRLGSGA